MSFNTIPLDILRNKKVKILHSIISCEYNNREQFIHCWDGNNFFELTSFEYPIDIIEHCCSTGKYLEGMQITGRSMQSVFYSVLFKTIFSYLFIILYDLFVKDTIYIFVVENMVLVQEGLTKMCGVIL